MEFGLIRLRLNTLTNSMKSFHQTGLINCRKLGRSRWRVLCPTLWGKTHSQNWLATIFYDVTCFRVIVFATGLDFMSSLPPNLILPEDNIWEVFVTVVRWDKTFLKQFCIKIKLMHFFVQFMNNSCFRSARNVSVRVLGSKYTEQYDNLMSDMDLHYFDKKDTPGNQHLFILPIINYSYSWLRCDFRDNSWQGVCCSNINWLAQS